MRVRTTISRGTAVAALSLLTFAGLPAPAPSADAAQGTWTRAVAAALAGTSRANILFVGDSMFEADMATSRENRWIDKFVAQLRTAYGLPAGGTGWVPAYWSNGVGPNVQTGGGSGVGVADSDDSQGRRGATVPNGRWIQFTVTGDSVDLVYARPAGASTILKVSIDGGAATSVDAGAAPHAWGNTSHFSLGSSGGHTVRVTASGGTVQVDGLQVYDGDYAAGISYWDSSRSGADSSHFLAGTGASQAWENADIDLIIESLYGNDFGPGSWVSGDPAYREPSVTVANFEARVNRYKALPNHPRVVVMLYWDVDGMSGNNAIGYSHQDYRNAIIAKAAELGGVEVINLKELHPASLPEPGMAWISSDGAHPNNAGYQVIANDVLAKVTGIVAPNGSIAGSVERPDGTSAPGTVTAYSTPSFDSSDIVATDDDTTDGLELGIAAGTYYLSYADTSDPIQYAAQYYNGSPGGTTSPSGATGVEVVSGHSTIANFDVATPPDPPAVLNLTAQPGVESVTLTWDIAEGATSYVVERSISGSLWAWANGTTTDSITDSNSLTVSSLTTGTEYLFRVAARAGTVTGPWATTDPVSPLPLAVTGLTAVVSAPTSVSLTWDETQGATSYFVERSIDGGEVWAWAGGSATNSTTTTNSFRLTDLVTGTEYIFRVAARADTVWGPWATSDPVTPDLLPITRLTATPGVGSVTLAWDSNPDATSYFVERSIDGGGIWAWANGSTAASTTQANSITITSLSASQQYLFRVAARTDSAQGPWVVLTSSVSPTDVVVTGLVASPGVGSATLTWDSLPDATKYVVAKSNDGGTTWTTTAYPTRTTITITGLTPEEWLFRVGAHINDTWTPWSTPTAPTVPTPLPPTVTGLVASPGVGSATLTWDSLPDATKYVVAKSNDGGTTWTTTAYPTRTTITITGLTPEEWLFRVGAHINDTWTPWSTPTAPTVPTPLPPTVTGLVASPGVGSATLTWDSLPDATKYVVAKSNDGGTTWTTTAYPTRTTITITGLTPEEWLFRVGAHINDTWTPWSTPTAPTVPTPLPPTVTGLVASPGVGSATLTWDSLPDATKYVVAKSNDGGTTWTTTAYPTRTTITITGLTPEEWLFRVGAHINDTWTPWSTPTAPTVPD